MEAESNTRKKVTKKRKEDNGSEDRARWVLAMSQVWGALCSVLPLGFKDPCWHSSHLYII